MNNVIDMQLMRYINLFERVSRVSTRHCFVYNNVIIFVVPRAMVSKAVGKNGINMKSVGEILRKKIKVVAMTDNIEQFIADVVSPITFTKAEEKDGLVTLTAGRQSKAALIGRGRQRENELQDILKIFFKIGKLKIA